MDANPAVPINERRGAERGRRNARRVAPVDPQTNFLASLEELRRLRPLEDARQDLDEDLSVADAVQQFTEVNHDDLASTLGIVYSYQELSSCFAWQGSDSDNQWLPASYCNCHSLVRQYYRKKKERELGRANENAVAPTSTSAPYPSSPIPSSPSPTPSSPSPEFSPLPRPVSSSPSSFSSSSLPPLIFPSPTSPSPTSPSPAFPSPTTPSPTSPSSAFPPPTTPSQAFSSPTSPSPTLPAPGRVPGPAPSSPALGPAPGPAPPSEIPNPEGIQKKKKSKKKRVRHVDKVAKHRICHNRNHMANACPNPRYRPAKIQKTN
ncbi:hypothetical protein OUZ56_025281 [Daphnia magna]|uniref:Uncharacterized protein n=1 Tax=Daphnia magna TaxID=35525 RepID=A0ABQ9ZJD2_9CRUS|nr:hypothetical protein OUZ56_025281 [Daphnia magna]